ncbi:MAG: ATP-binding protein [Mycobacterium sp.]|nr:ATP-binding protein [Mycobacterium sp.]
MPEGGWIDVTVSAGDGAALMTVRNSGPVVSPADVGTIFEPFRRLAATERVGSGAGLGLSIVRSVATAHGGEAHAVARPEGGLAVSVTLPSDQ